MEADQWGYIIVKTIEARSTYNTEDWLIIVSTDHCGTETDRGDQTKFKRMIWPSCNKQIEMSEENRAFANK